MSQGQVLVVDDKPSMRRMIADLLANDFAVTTAEDGARAIAYLKAGDFDVVISDIRMPGMDGNELLAEAKRLRPGAEFILITAFASVSSAVEAMKSGAYHYLKKPFEPEELRMLVDRAIERKRLAERAERLQNQLDAVTVVDTLVGKTATMQRLANLIERAAARDTTVLITGESGTGKELVARAVHKRSRRNAGPFVVINCGALPENLVESELFGHVKGAFTGAVRDKIGLFEEASGGTLFLDEIGDLPKALQVKLTRVLQESTIRRVGANHERPVDVRVFAATHSNLKESVDAGNFREDLYYRLNVFPIAVPPLRERTEDIPLLAAHFLRQAKTGEASHRTLGFSPSSLQAMARYDWPGNVRQLENAVERAVAFVDGTRIELEHLPEEIGTTAAPGEERCDLALTHREYVEAAKARASREYLVSLMERFAGNVTHAASHAGIERESLHRLLKKHAVTPRDFKVAAQ